MVRHSVWLLAAAVAGVRSQSTSQTASAALSSSSSSSTTTSSSGSNADAVFSYTQNISFITTSLPTSAFTGSMYTYLSYGTQRTVVAQSSSTVTGSSTSHNSQITRTTASDHETQIVGLTRSSSTIIGSGTATSSSAAPSNTLPCNGYSEFCNRKYSNITQVCAHNSAFSVKNNAASNQIYDITTQLKDGIRMLQGETHYYNGAIYNCHTSCSLLNAGTWQSSLETLVTWLESNPYDVVTWLIVNSDFLNVENYTTAIENSGILQYLYEPQYIPQRRDQWPTLGQMILSGKRVVMFMDYNANQDSVPYILDEFTHIWETPFSPTDESFPCTEQRPPNLNQTTAENEFMYLANHNLNTAISLSALLGTSDDSTVLIPNTAYINRTNGEYNQFGQLQAMSLNCTAEWGRPPTWLLVDYYNYGDPGPGSVFEVAAKANGVTYTQSCCGTTQSPAPVLRASMLALAAAVTFASLLLS